MHAIFNITQPVEKYTKFQRCAPIPNGKFFPNQTLHLYNSKQELITCSLRPLQLWPDQSIKWLSCEGIFNQSQAANKSLYVSQQAQDVTSKREKWVIEDHSSLTVKTNKGDYCFDFAKFCSLRLQKQVSVACQAELINTKISLASLSSEYEVVYDSLEHPLYCKVEQQVDVIIEHQVKAKLRALFTIYYADGNVLTTLSIHNTQAIVANNGQWDLGNENSLYIKSLSLIFNYQGKHQKLYIENEQDGQPYDFVQLTQYSSGGDNWQSENHKTRRNKVELKHKGAKGSIVFNDLTTEIESLRPEPFIEVALKQEKLFIQPVHFWQKFPTGIRSSSKRTVVDFADQKSGCEVELQPGEIKTHSAGFSLDSSCSFSQLRLDESICINHENMQQSNAIPFINSSLLQHPLHKALVTGESPEKKWLDKREALDEFGWRNFGDLFADHEAAHFTGTGTFVSHYNNQYDPLFGFLKLWLITGDSAYKILADELFEHIVNIDIYHTTNDKPEYNNGMFWHTDHYVPAETASHRTYSKHQASNVYMDHIGGGGPGSHHCYSTGLAFYYLLSGNQEAKKITLNLCDWMQQIYEGDNTLLGLVIRIKNANHLKVPFTNKLLLGSGTGVLRNIFTNKYPLDRGTGNNVNILLDSFIITQKQLYLRQAEFVILHTISSADDINERNFDNIEETWFYTVFLQAVAKYLLCMSHNISAQVNQHTNDRISEIKAAYIHYASWMAHNETHYLANKDVLEYPNDTWTGQDLRKIQILLCAFEITQQSVMLEKAQELLGYVYPSLLKSEERDYTRIQALIMQNYIDENCVKGQFEAMKMLLDTSVKSASKTLSKTYFARMLRFITRYSIKREIDLLCVRIPFFNKVFRR